MAASEKVDGWIASLPPHNQAIAAALRRLITEAGPKFTEAIKWGQPTYSLIGNVCYIASNDDRGYVSLGFFNGASLTDPAGNVEGTGKKMRHVKVRSLDAMNEARLLAWVREAAKIDAK